MMIAQPEHATGSPWYGMGIVVKVGISLQETSKLLFSHRSALLFSLKRDFFISLITLHAYRKIVISKKNRILPDSKRKAFVFSVIKDQ